jgi:transposase-like protein
MATTTTKVQPAAGKGKQPAKVEKPAAKAEGGVTVKALAERLGTNEKSLRSRIRKINGGTLPEGQSRYTWGSFNDPELKELISKLKGEKKAE